MSKHLLGSLKFSGGILSIYCLSLAIVPAADAQTAPPNNVSVTTGARALTGGFNSIAPNSSTATGSGNSRAASAVSVGGTVSGGVGGAAGAGVGGAAGAGGVGGAGVLGARGKASTISTTNPQAIIRSSQVLQAQLDAAQAAYDSASARLAQLPAVATTPPSPDSKLSPIRYALKPTAPGDCGCNNPDVTTKPADNSAELAAAREAQSKAATELAEAQAQARQFLASVQKAAEISAQNNAFSPVW